jgi:hypothetical protein
VPNVDCPTCGLRSYAAAPHSAHPRCPYCDADLLDVVAPPDQGAGAPVVRPPTGSAVMRWAT